MRAILILILAIAAVACCRVEKKAPFVIYDKYNKYKGSQYTTYRFRDASENVRYFLADSTFADTGDMIVIRRTQR